jgi:hypothetical protein
MSKKQPQQIQFYCGQDGNFGFYDPRYGNTRHLGKLTLLFPLDVERINDIIKSIEKTCRDFFDVL